MGTGMNTYGWIFFIAANFAIISLSAYCMWKVLGPGAKKPE